MATESGVAKNNQAYSPPREPQVQNSDGLAGVSEGSKQQSEAIIRKIIEVLEADQKEAKRKGIEQSDWAEIRARIPETEPEVLQYLKSISLKSQPTEVLMDLAQKLQERREVLFPELDESNEFEEITNDI